MKPGHIVAGPDELRCGPTCEQLKHRLSSPRNYRAYQREVALRAVLPFLRECGVELRGKILLDVGCGQGGMEEVWAAEGATPVGMDLNPEKLGGLPGNYVAGDALSLPFKSGTFDLVLSHDCIEHVHDTVRALAEARRVVTPGGAAFFSFPPFFGPYGGHQHGGRTWVKYVPYGHLLPRWIWLGMAASDAYARMFKGLARLSMKRFESEAAAAGFGVVARRAFVVRPEVALRWRLRPLSAGFLQSRRVGMRSAAEMLATGAFYLLA